MYFYRKLTLILTFSILNVHKTFILSRLKQVIYRMEETQRFATKIIGDIKDLPYYKNYAAASGAVHNISNHEEAVGLVFNNNGLKQWIPKASEKPTSDKVWSWINYTLNEDVNKGILETPMPDYSYISQPCGTHDSPDFLVKLEKNIFIGIECKSADGYSPMYNSGGIKQNLIYVFCSKKVNATTIYVGKDVLSIEQQKLIDELISKQRLLEKEYNEKLKAIDIHHRGVSYYTRPMIQQSGGAEYTDYFTHRERQQCEQQVYLFLNSIIEKNYK